MIKKKNKTVLVVDDEQSITKMIALYLQNSGYDAVCANNGREALRLFDQHNPALVILDLMLPELSGEEVCKALRNKSRVPIIMLTAKISESDALSGLGLGADDYIRKPFSPRELMARVEAMIRRASSETTLLAPSLAYNNGDLVIDSNRLEVRINGKSAQLTPKEFSILFTLANHPNKIFSREELINLSLGDFFDGYDRVIDSHIKNIRQKIETETHKYIKTIHGAGYMFTGEYYEKYTS